MPKSGQLGRKVGLTVTTTELCQANLTMLSGCPYLLPKPKLNFKSPMILCHVNSPSFGISHPGQCFMSLWAPLTHVGLSEKLYLSISGNHMARHLTWLCRSFSLSCQPPCCSIAISGYAITICI